MSEGQAPPIGLSATPRTLTFVRAAADNCFALHTAGQPGSGSHMGDAPQAPESASPILAPEVGRVLKLSRPQTDFRRASPIFISSIIWRVFPEGDRLALLDHPLTDVDAFN